jgi:hypothetical protein
MHSLTFGLLMDLADILRVAVGTDRRKAIWLSARFPAQAQARYDG